VSYFNRLRAEFCVQPDWQLASKTGERSALTRFHFSENAPLTPFFRRRATASDS